MYPHGTVGLGYFRLKSFFDFHKRKTSVLLPHLLAKKYFEQPHNNSEFCIFRNSEKIEYTQYLSTKSVRNIYGHSHGKKKFWIKVCGWSFDSTLSFEFG